MLEFNTGDYTLEGLKGMFDEYYMYSDDHLVYMKHQAISKAIQEREAAAKKENMENEDA